MTAKTDKERDEKDSGRVNQSGQEKCRTGGQQERKRKKEKERKRNKEKNIEEEKKEEGEANTSACYEAIRLKIERHIDDEKTKQTKRRKEKKRKRDKE